jgi:Family of unknown function (DUF6364)
MARNVTIQLDDDLIRAAKVLAAEEGISLSAMVARDIRVKLSGRARRERAMRIALESMAEAASSGRTIPAWSREEINER